MHKLQQKLDKQSGIATKELIGSIDPRRHVERRDEAEMLTGAKMRAR